MLNSVQLQGRLTSDPELRHTQNGTAVSTFRLAVERNFKNKDTGERKADFINIIAWRQAGEFVSRYFSKGQLAVVSGSLQVREYTDRDGNRRWATEVVADHVYFCGSSKDGASKDGSNADHSAYNVSQPGGPDEFQELMNYDSDELPF